ncbi:MAG: DegT/DnrJ/EryC1/StrS family aminotransferase [Deltaproteobacteria bacterium]|jgi:dTDP-4-amino-4,6-dideoxygalactose transaminase|nr:DegT/DnrJ/EryC1/StrS family aminotransferase [Deltaproteobacteria bacterium]
MAKRIGRTLPPAASPFHLKDIVSGIAGIFEGEGIVERFENELKSFFKVRYCFAVSSGKAALVLILHALHEICPERDEVLIPAYTCYSVPSAIVKAGLKIRLCEMAPGTLDFDFDRIAEELKNPRLLCVVPTHLFGMPADVERLKALICRGDIFVLEDAAQAMGGVWNGNKMGTQGDVGLFSMGRGKAFSTVEGGIILTDNDQIGQILEKRLFAIKGYGDLDSLKLFLNAIALSILIYPEIYWLPKLLPFLKLGETHFNPSFPIRRLSSFQAGMARKWSTAINKFKAARLLNVNKIARYGIKFPGVYRGSMPDLIRFPVLVADTETKKKILKKSEMMGLGISGGYPHSIDGINELRNLLGANKFPVAKDLAERIVTLPVHPYVNNDDLGNIMHLFQESSYV